MWHLDRRKNLANNKFGESIAICQIFLAPKLPFIRYMYTSHNDFFHLFKFFHAIPYTLIQPFNFYHLINSSVDCADSYCSLGGQMHFELV